MSILIVLHELGHFIPARIFKTRVEKFYLFFDPWFSLFKFKRKDTEYGIGWLPLGGYVKISGMIDESMDKEQMKQPPQPWEFRSKPAWQRLIIMIGGVTVNLILGILIFIFITFVWGEIILPPENAKYGVAFDSTAVEAGFKDGDKILFVDGKKPVDLFDLPKELIIEGTGTVTVLRGGETLDVHIPDDLAKRALRRRSTQLINPIYPVMVDSVLEGSNAKKAGLKKNDLIVGLNSDSILHFYQFQALLQRHKNQTVSVQVKRGEDIVSLNPLVTEAGTIGFSTLPADQFLDFETIHYSFLQSIPRGFNRGLETLSSYVKQFKLVFTKEGASQVGGFISFANLFSSGGWDWQRFWSFTALISIILAFMNILPIPALDGGHIMFLLYEIITRKKPHEKVMEYAQYVGMVILLALLLWANGNDVARLFK